jgi:DNA-binding beta-propeller fold protein YncE
VLGPTGLAFDAEHNLLYVASTADNEVFVVPNASTTRSDHGTGRLVVNDSVHLHGPLGLVLAPNGNLIIANGDGVNSDPAQPSEITEFTTKGQFVAQFSLQAQFDAPFGIALDASGKTLRFAAVNDDTNTVEVFQVHR